MKNNSDHASAFKRHGIGHLSASSVNLFVAQPALWAASYLLKKRPPVGPAAHRGTAIEHGVEAGLFDPEMPVETCQKLACERYHSLTRFSADPRVEKEREAVSPSVAVALAELRPYGVPDKAEDRQHRIEVTLSGVPVPFVGFLDFLFGNKGLILDLKSVARIPSEMGYPHARQGALYTSSGSNLETRMAYVSAKKMSVLPVMDVARHLADCARIGQAIGNLLSLSDDPERLVACYYPDLSSFYWGDASARSIANEIWNGDVPNGATAADAVDW